jgi:deoxyhypusine synthase
MTETSASCNTNGAVPASVADAVLVHGSMPAGSQKVEELDFNKFAGRPITVDDLMSGMNHMGFQASSIGEAVRIINDMVFGPFHPTIDPSITIFSSERGAMLRSQT